MKHIIKISVSKDTKEDGIVRCRNITVREKILRLLLGSKHRLTVIVPGESVETLSINEIENKGGEDNEQN